ncbi:hypothetical protein ACFWV1_26415 [Streptomyces sp. NPDC058700]|uniref:hypothetical protein n=1 Tax=Streptomyces sp. NPDC058700 TaxID=3346607 RepID=UPI0036681C08
MSAEEIAQNEGASVERAAVPASGLSLPAAVCDGDTLVDSLDIVVLIQLLYDTVSGRKVTPLETWRRLQARGIRSTKNRNELVGKNSVYDSYGRLIEAGYVERYEKPNEKHPGRKGSIAYRVYDNPAWNPTWQAQHVGVEPLGTGKSDSAKPQVRTLPGTGDPVSGEVEPPNKAAGQNTSRNWGSGVPGSGVPGSVKRVIPAGQIASLVPGSSKASPPLPPGGGTTPPPTPSSDGPRPHPSQTEEEVVFDEEELAAAVRFLEQLPAPWDHGPADARENAPILLAQMRRVGWPSILEADLPLLTRSTTGNAGGSIGNYPALYRARRIPNLKPLRGSTKPAVPRPALPSYPGDGTDGPIVQRDVMDLLKLIKKPNV